MVSQMELWFNSNVEAASGMKQFKPEVIDLKKLIEHQDINEVLVLTEFILCIILKCENSEDLLQRFLEIQESSAEDMQQLIEGANIQMSEYDGA